MKIPITIDGEVLYAEIPDEEINKLVAKKNRKTGYERANLGSSYYAINDFREIFEFDEENEPHDQSGYDVANYYTDKTVAENMARAQLLWNKIHRRAIELCSPAIINSEQLCYTITFNSRTGDVFPTGWSAARAFGVVWFDTENHCRQVIDEFRDELLWYFTEFRDRADI